MRHIYRITDGGEEWLYSAADEKDAVKQHMERSYTTLVPNEAGLTCKQVPDNKQLVIRDSHPVKGPLTIDAGALAQIEPGLIGGVVSR